MAIFSSTNYTAQVAGTQVVPGPGLATTMHVAIYPVALTIAAAATDTLNFGYLPAGARIVSMSLQGDQVDSNGAPTFKLDLGDGTTAAKFFSASKVGQVASAVDLGMLVANAGLVLTAKTLLVGTINTVAATKVAGNIVLTVEYTIDQ